MELSPERLARLERHADRAEIEDAVRRIARGIDRFDRELFLSGYHPDAVIDAGSMVAHPAEVYEIGRALHAEGQSSTLHHLTNFTCEIAGDTAHAETYWIYAGRNRDGGNWVAGGRYADRLERRDGEWRVAFRYTIGEWSGAVPANQAPLFTDVPDLHANGKPSRNGEDPSYRRPLTNLRALRLPQDPARLGKPEG